MKKLELLDRKRTTENAKQEVINFIKGFDFDPYLDLPFIKSKPFDLYFSINGGGTKHDRAYFAIGGDGFLIVSFASDDENGYCCHKENEWKDAAEVFDGTCTFVDFKELVDAMEDFIAKINNAVTEKEQEIADFCSFCEAWKSK